MREVTSEKVLSVAFDSAEKLRGIAAMRKGIAKFCNGKVLVITTGAVTVARLFKNNVEAAKITDTGTNTTVRVIDGINDDELTELIDELTEGALAEVPIRDQLSA